MPKVKAGARGTVPRVALTGLPRNRRVSDDDMVRIVGVGCNLADILTEVAEGQSHLVHLG